MNTTPLGAALAATKSPERTRQRAVLAIIGAAIVLGLGLAFGFSWQLADLWITWTTDPLRSIGMAIPAASLILAVRSWRPDDWSRGGTWWGLPVLVLALTLALLTAAAPLTLRLPGDLPHNLDLIPAGVLLCAYTSGVVLFFAGTRAWRKAWFPLLLLLFVQPVPGWFDSAVDLPLQYFAAHAARGFAALIGVAVSQGTLKMMFTPHLGMFIAPGCDGLRGAIAMGYLALVVGYLYRLRWLRWGAYVVLAVALAYLFNFVRLCGVVVYYWFSMRIPVIAHHATLADYLIGGVLFFFAALFLFSIPRWWRPRPCTPNSSSQA